MTPVSVREVWLSIRNQCLLVRSFARAGFVAILDYAAVNQHLLRRYRFGLRATSCSW